MMIADLSVAEGMPSRGGAGKLKEKRLMMALSRILTARPGTYNLQSAFAEVTTNLQTLVPHDAAVLMSWQDRQQNARVETFTPEDLDIRSDRYLPASSVVIEICRRNLGAAVCLNTAYSPDALERSLAHNGICSSITLPLNREGQRTYLVTLGAAQSEAYNSTDAQFLKKLNPHIAACLKPLWGANKDTVRQQAT